MNVYVIGADDRGPHKIGISLDPVARLAALQAGSPLPLRLVKVWPLADARRVELEAHSVLADRAAGREWFHVSAVEAVAVVEGAIAAPLRKPPKRRPVRQPRNIDLNAVLAEAGEGAVLKFCDGLCAAAADLRARNDATIHKAFPGGVPAPVHDPSEGK